MESQTLLSIADRLLSLSAVIREHQLLPESIEDVIHRVKSVYTHVLAVDLHGNATIPPLAVRKIQECLGRL